MAETPTFGMHFQMDGMVFGGLSLFLSCLSAWFYSQELDPGCIHYFLLSFLWKEKEEVIGLCLCKDACRKAAKIILLVLKNGGKNLITKGFFFHPE